MIDALWLALQAAGLVVLLHACGAALFLAQFREAINVASLARLRRLALRVSGGALVVLLAQVLLAPAHLAGAWDGVADPALWHLALFSPGAVGAWLRLAGLVAVVLSLARPARLVGLGLPGALAALSSFLVSGHTLVDSHRLALLPLLALHTLVATFWFGALIPLAQLLRLREPAVGAVLMRFSARALRLVPLLGLAGLLMAWLLLPGLAALGTPYGKLLCLKALLFVCLMGLAALNRLRLAPLVARGRDRARAALARSIAAEYLLLVVVLLATAVLTGLYSPGGG